MRFILINLVVLSFFATPVLAKDKILDIKEITTSEGIKAWLSEDHTLPIVSLSFAFKGAGAVNNEDHKQGLSRILSNMLDEGAGDLTSQEFQKILSDNSISLSFSSGRDDFSGQVETLSRNKKKAFDLLKLTLTKPRFDEEPLDRMVAANVVRIKSSQTDPNWIEARLFNDIAYAGHPYSLNSGGTISTLQSLSADDLREFKKNFLTKDRLVVSASGDISERELRKIIDDVFGDLPATGKKTNIDQHSVQNLGRTFLFKKDIPQTLITTALPSIGREDPDYYALIMMNHIFGSSGFGSRLMNEAREKRGLTYGIYSDTSVQDYVTNFTISTSTKNKTAKEMLKIIEDEMKNMKNKPVSDQELEDAKSYIIGSMPLSLTSTSSISSIMLDLMLRERPITYLDDFPAHIKEVSSEDIMQVAKRILNPDKMVIVMVGDPNGMKQVKIVKEVPNVD